MVSAKCHLRLFGIKAPVESLLVDVFLVLRLSQAWRNPFRVLLICSSPPGKALSAADQTLFQGTGVF